jgi:TolB protein
MHPETPMTVFRFSWVANTLAAVVTLLCPLRAGAIQMVISGPGSQQFPIAISQLKNLSGDDSHRSSADFTSTLGRNLELSGFFKIVNPEANIEDPQNSGYQFGKFNFADWSSINTEFLVKGAVTINGESATLEAFLYDVPRQRQLTGKRYTGQISEVPRMARRFADEIMLATTGTRGPFDSTIACTSTRGGRFKEIYKMSLDGQDFSRLTDNSTINLFPSLDRGARQLLYTSYKSGDPALYLADLGTQREREIRMSGGRLFGGALAPDGSRIAASLERGGATNLFLLDGSGNVIRPLTSGRSINVSPSFSPDGQSIAYTSDQAGSPQVYVISVEGGRPRRVTYKGNYNTDPAFSPKGDKIAYQTRHGGGFDLCLIPAAGGDPAQLTDGGSNTNPTWSPDERYLVFSSGREGQARLYLMLVESGKIISPITEDKGDDTGPSWSWWANE